MTESEPQFIVRMPDGRKSKPTKKSHIREMHLTGKISDDAVVQKVGTVFDVPIRVFLGLPDLAAAAVQNESTVGYSHGDADDEAVELEPLSSHLQQGRPIPSVNYRGRNRATAGFFSALGAFLAWPIQGFIIPTRGVNQTRDYLRRTIAWIELWLKLIHLSSLAVLLLMTGTAILLMVVEIRFMQGNGPRNLWGMFLRIAVGSYTYLAVFIALVISEAFLRVVPASLRYWIEATEERRETDRIVRGNTQQRPTSGN